MSIVPGRVTSSTRGGLAPIARALHRIGVSANAVTVVGLLITVAGAALLVTEQPLPALAVLLVGTLADTLDGQIARVAGGGTQVGAFLDSTLDRLSDAALAGASLALGAASASPVLFWGGFALLVASFLVPYMRAKAESLGVGGSVGLAPREARVGIYVLGVAAWAIAGNQQLYAAAVAVAALLASITAIQRLVHVMKALNERGDH